MKQQTRMEKTQTKNAHTTHTWLVFGLLFASVLSLGTVVGAANEDVLVDPECIIAIAKLEVALGTREAWPTDEAFVLAREIVGKPCNFAQDEVAAPAPTEESPLDLAYLDPDVDPGVVVLDPSGVVPGGSIDIGTPDIAADACSGAGGGSITSSLVVNGRPIPLLTEPAVGDFERAGSLASINAEGATVGLKANSAGAATIRIGGVYLPAAGSASVSCGDIESKVCKKVLWWKVCGTVKTPIACSGSGSGAIGAAGIIEFSVSASLTNPVCNQRGVNLDDDGVGDLALAPSNRAWLP